MAIFKRSVDAVESQSPDSITSNEAHWKESGTHREDVTTTATDARRNFQVSRTGGGDVALALFSSPLDAKEPIDPFEEKKVVRKIDFMVLPYLAVCYV